MAPGPNNRHVQMAAQILNFCETAPRAMTSTIADTDWDLADKLVKLAGVQTSVDYSYPVDWVERRTSLRTAIGRWRPEARKLLGEQDQPEGDKVAIDDASADVARQPTPATSEQRQAPIISLPKQNQPTTLNPNPARPPHPITPQNQITIPGQFDSFHFSPRHLPYRRRSVPGPLHSDDTPSEAPDRYYQRLLSFPSPSLQSPLEPAETPESEDRPPETGRALPPQSIRRSSPAVAPPIMDEAGGRQQQQQQAPDPMVLTPETAALLLAQATARIRADVQDDTTRAMALLLAQAMRGQDNPIGNNAPRQATLRPADVGLFNPDATDPTGAGMISDSKTTTYTDVFAFTDRLKHLRALRGEDPVREVWTQCLQGSALVWHSQVLTETDRHLLNVATIDVISAKLLDRFRGHYSTAMDRIKKARFTLKDVSAGRNIQEFVQTVIRDAKTCDFGRQGQLQAAYQAFDGAMQGMIQEPTETTSVDEFLRNIKAKESAIHRQASEQASARRTWQPIQQPTLQTRNQGYRRNTNQAGYLDFRRQQNFPDGGNRGNFVQQPPAFVQTQQNGNANPFGQAPPQPAQAPPVPRWNNAQKNQNAPRYAGYQQARDRNPAAFPARRASVHYADANEQTEQGQHDGPDPDEGEPQDDHASDDEHDSYWLDSEPPGPVGDWVEAPGFPEDDVADARLVATVRWEETIGTTSRCFECGDTFPSRNTLFNHLERAHGKIRKLGMEEDRGGHDARQESGEQCYAATADRPLGRLAGPRSGTRTRRSNHSIGCAVPTWILPRRSERASGKPESTEDICADTGCSVTLADEEWVAHHYLELEIRQKATPLLVRGIGSNKHSTDKYVIMDMNFVGTTLDGKPAIATFMREVMLVGELRANMLLGMDAMAPEKFDILMSRGHALIQSCGVTIQMAAWQKGRPTITPVTARENVIIPPGKQAMVQVIQHANPNQDYIVEPARTKGLAMYALLADSTLSEIIVRNESHRHITIQRRQKLGDMHSIDPNAQAYRVETAWAAEAAEMATSSDQRKEHHLLERRDILPVHQDRTQKTSVHPETPDASTAANLDAAKSQAWRHRSGVTVHHNRGTTDAERIGELLTAYETLFQDKGFAKVPMEERMRIQMKPGWQDEIPKKCKVYPVGPDDRQLIRETMGKMEAQGKACRTKGQVPFAFPVFTRQEDITAKIANATHVTTMDAMSFYYQWLLHLESQWAFTIVTTDGQYSFKVPIMGYKGSNAYVQRQIDNILHGTNADAYCDDIVIASVGIDQHLRDLEEVFQRLLARNISIGPTKTFAGFPVAIVLGKLVDALGLTTTAEKLAAQRKTQLQRAAKAMAPKKNAGEAPEGTKKRQARGKWSRAILLATLSNAELASFNQIKEALTKNTVLKFYSTKRPLFVDFDASARGFGAVVYHVKSDALAGMMKGGEIVKPPPCTAREPIAFLSRTLSDAETRYWSTELETAGFVWTISKTKQWIDATETPPVVCFTDHKSIIDMMRQVDIANTTARPSVNKKLVRALEYISRFNVRVLHKSGETNLIPDALSRLPTTNNLTDAEAPGQLEDMPDDRSELWSSAPQHTAFLGSSQRPPAAMLFPDGQFQQASPTTHMVELSQEFRQKLQKGYDTDPTWRHTLDVIAQNRKLRPEDRATLPFKLHRGLLWKADPHTPDRLCIPKNCVTDIFETLHDQNHIGYGKLSEFLTHYCIPRAQKLFREYIATCPICKVYQQRRHKAYGSLQPIIPPPCPYYCITIDFISALPTSDEGFDSAMVIVDKFSKETIIRPCKKSDTAQQTGDNLLESLLTANWGIPKTVVSDRDPKFLAATDGQTERMIQFIESLLRIWLGSLPTPGKWPKAIPPIQFEINNTKSATTKRSPNELVKGFTPNNISTIIANQSGPRTNLPLGRLEAHDAIAIASMSMKKYYD
ncbi:hypothetical protein G7046_g2573 [Stylonectria norvegica]|nr:hypothetical protein G7046_g2573 [Stylonectria norvegica]